MNAIGGFVSCYGSYSLAAAYAILPHVFAEDTWIQAAQILPDNPRVLHHCNMAFANLAEGFKESNFITGYVPGGEAMIVDDGVAYRIPKGSILALQMGAALAALAPVVLLHW